MMPDIAPIRRANRLAREKSPYLRQHAYNPVDWFSWGEEAFAKARAEEKPIFLSIGYSTCHWCHVMAHESFENEVIAQALNRDFVPVKVDREERPDVDRIYMTYVQAATGKGGWPMSVWLTPELKPFFGGTYFPPEDRWGRPGFAAILAALGQAWANEREQLLAEGDRVTEMLQQYSGKQDPRLRIPNPKKPSGSMDGDACEKCFRQLAGSFDATWGGFGGAPKFPRAAVFNFLFREAVGFGRRGDAGDASDRARAGGAGGTLSGAEAAGSALQMAVHTLRQMAAGGIHDHVGGGFHRYSVDEEWFVPHFEKMLYDQAQLAVSYLEARQATGDERYAWVARDIFDYVLRDLAHPAGGFYSAEDADSEIPESGYGKPEGHSAENGSEASVGGQADAGSSVRFPVVGIRDRQHAEGAFYVWTKKEIVQALDDGAAMPSSPADAPRASRLQVDADFFCANFDVKFAGNVSGAGDPHGEFRGRNILRQRRPLPDTAQQFGLDLAAASDRIQAGLLRLRETRSLRPRPQLDDKIITAWNGLMISALAKGYQVLRDGAYLEAAVRAVEFIQRELYDEPAGVLYRSYCNGRGNVPGFAEDYAYLVQGLLDLYEAAFDIRRLQWAGQLQAVMDEQFWDAEHGGYCNSRAEDRSIIARLKENYDGAEPAPSSVAALNLLRLEVMIGNDAGPDRHGLSKAGRALQCVEAFRGQWTAAPHSLPQMLCALACIQSPPRTIVIAGDPGAGDFRALATVTHERLGPRHVVLAADQAEGQAWLASRRPYLAEMKPIGGRAAAYVCENFTCQQPVTDPAALRWMLRG
jgi:uncharacterized protein YyaL (SSP411 family)